MKPVIKLHPRHGVRSLAVAMLLLSVTIAIDPAGAAPSPILPAKADAAMQSISTQRIADHVKFLASDLLEGRGTGARGGDIAAEYIATQFALDGLKPAGDNGSYLQKVAFTGTQTHADAEASIVPDSGQPMKLRYGDDYVLVDQTGASHSEIDAPLVFVGFGIQAPEYQWDDFKGVDVKGKMLVLFVNEPESTDPKFFTGPALTYYGRWSYKYEEAARLGAVGVLIIHRTDLASYGWGVVRNSWSGEDVSLTEDTSPKLHGAAWIQQDIARQLFAASGRDLDDLYKAANSRDFKPIALPAHFKASWNSDVRHFESSNVVAMLPGSDPGAPTQVVMYTAHYDHLGIVPPKPGDDSKDDIYNGAIDNGTGCGVLLELAHAWATSGIKPKHPILFASVTAEEKGLLGSRFLGEHPPVPARDIALDLNYDAIPAVGDPVSVEVSGAERTTFYPTVQKVAKGFGFTIEPDAEPGAGHYYRSDHFSLARVGVPAFSIGTGVLFAGHDAAWGHAQREDYTAHHYHQPSDEFDPKWDFIANAKLAKFGFALGWLESAAPKTVDWQPGDEFAAARHTAGH